MSIQKLKSYLKQQNIDCALFYNLRQYQDSNYYYFTRSHAYGICVIPKQKKPIILAPEMEFGRINNEKKRFTIKKLTKESLKDTLAHLTNNDKQKTIALDYPALSYNDVLKLKKIVKGIKIKDISYFCSDLRSIKTKEEINFIQKACKIADDVLKKTIINFKQFNTEAEVSAYIKYQIHKTGSEISFEPIVATGKNPAIPHHTPSRQKIRKGFMVIDFGVKYKGYCSDMTRTFYIGKPSKKEILLYEKILHTQKQAIKKVKEGTKVSDIDRFTKQEIGEYFHGVGHGIGLDIHESPSLSSKSTAILKQNMVITIEPGSYQKNKYGIRIEDDVLVTKSKPKILSHYPKDLIILT